MKKPGSSSFIQNLRLGTAFRFAVFFGLLTLGSSCRNPKTYDFSIEPAEGYFLDESGSRDAPPADDAFTSRLDLSQNISSRAKVWLRYSLPQDTSFDRLFAKGCTNIESLYQDHQKLESSDLDEPVDNAFTFATLNSGMRPSQLYFKVKLSENKRYEVSCHYLKLTTLNHAIWYYLVSASPVVISGTIICFLGILSLVLSISVFSWTLLYFGVHSLIFGVFILSDLDVVVRAFSHYSNFRISGGFLILISFLLFFEEFIGSKKHLARKLAFFIIPFSIVFQVCETLYPMLYKDLIRPNVVNIGIFSLALVLLFAFEAASQKRPYARAFALVTAILGVSVSIDMYNFTYSHDPFYLTPWVFLVIICSTQILLLKLNILEQTQAEQVRTEYVKKRNSELQLEVERRTEALALQAKELEGAHFVLEERVEILTKQKQSATEIAQEKDVLLLRITEIKKILIPRIVSRLQDMHDNPSPNDTIEIGELIDDLVKIYSKATQSTPDEKTKVQETIDLLSANKRYQRTFKSSIGGARLNLRTAESIEALLANINNDPSRLIVIDDSFVDSLPDIHEINPKATLVAFSEKDLATANHYQRKYPMLDQVLSLDLPKPILQKILLTHLMKLISQDVFGIEKYLMWGSAIKERPLDMRTHSADQWVGLSQDIAQAGLSEELEAKALRLAETLLEIRRDNLITSGKSDHHKLKQLRYGHDAHVFCLSVDLSGQILARHEIMRFFQPGDEGHKLALKLFDESHAIILNSNGNDRHELIVLLFQSNEEIPPAYYYTFIST